jgi:hypothetical protein
VQKAALVETYNSQQQQQQQWQPHKQPAASQSESPPIKPYQSNPWSPFGLSFISSGKQGGGATVLGEGCDIVPRETCIPTSFSEQKQLGKAAVLHFAFSPFCSWGHAKLSL